jgi:phosphoribosyl 1,2-cyclic phosphodiesterase
MITIHASGSQGNLVQMDNLLIDPGLPVAKIKKALNYKLSSMVGCLVSHEHMDHAKGAAEVMRAGVDVYCGEETAHALGLTGHRVHAVRHGQPFAVETWTVVPFDLSHDTPCLGFLIGREGAKILFVGDTNYIRPKFGPGLTHIVMNTNYDVDILREQVDLGYINAPLAARIVKNHLSLQTAEKFMGTLDLSQCLEIHLCHRSLSHGDPESFRKRIERRTGRPVYVY